MKYGAVMIPIAVILCLAVVYPLGVILLPF